MKVILLFATAMMCVSGARGETLYNGIEVPERWVFPNRLTREPLAEPPYLVQRPEVVPIDVGRQLFVDDFLVERSTLRRTHHLAKMHDASPVIRPDERSLGAVGMRRAGVFSDGVWFDPKDGLFKAWYFAGRISEKPLEHATALATSRDGITWEKPDFGVMPGTNVVLPDTDGLRRNSSTAWLDHFEKDPAKRFKMFRVVQRDNPDGKGHVNFIQYSTSADGVHWVLSGESTDTGDRTTVFHNPFRGRWVMGLREGWPEVSRCRGYHDGGDVMSALAFGDPVTRRHASNLWVGADALDPAREDLKLRRPASRPYDLVPSQLYNLDCVAYESVMLGLFSIWRGHPADELKRPKINEVCVGFSRDGFHWSRPDRRAFYGVSEDPTAWNHGNVQSCGGCCLVVGDQLYFYFGATGRVEGSATADPNTTGLAVLRRDGFTSLDAGDEEGSVTTRPVRFSGSRLFVNAAVPDGRLTVEVLDEGGKVIAPFDRIDCRTIRGDSTKREVRWDSASDLSALRGKAVRFRFHLTKGSLYAFWVSPDASGKSGGYVAAGGPGFTGPRDE